MENGSDCDRGEWGTVVYGWETVSVKECDLVIVTWNGRGGYVSDLVED